MKMFPGLPRSKLHLAMMQSAILCRNPTLLISLRATIPTVKHHGGSIMLVGSFHQQGVRNWSELTRVKSRRFL